MNLPDGFSRAGDKVGHYEDGSVDLMEIKLTPNGQVVVGIASWLGKMCEDGNEKVIALLTSIPSLVKDTVEQHLKVQ